MFLLLFFFITLFDLNRLLSLIKAIENVPLSPRFFFAVR